MLLSCFSLNCSPSTKSAHRFYLFITDQKFLLRHPSPSLGLLFPVSYFFLLFFSLALLGPLVACSVQFTQLCLTLCGAMNRSTPGLPVHHQLPEFTQIHVHRVSDAIQPSHPLSSLSPPAPNPSQPQSLFQLGGKFFENLPEYVFF